jgi:hypothetical protein
MRAEQEASMTTGGGLLLVMVDVDPEDEEELNRWYRDEHIAERLAIPGFRRARRFKAVEGSPKYLALYELDSPDVVQSGAYKHMKGAGQTGWTDRIEAKYKRFIRNVYVCISDDSSPQPEDTSKRSD